MEGSFRETRESSIPVNNLMLPVHSCQGETMLGKTRRAEKEGTEFARYVKLRLDLESVFDTSYRGQAEMSTPKSWSQGNLFTFSCISDRSHSFFLTKIVHLGILKYRVVERNKVKTFRSISWWGIDIKSFTLNLYHY